MMINCTINFPERVDKLKDSGLSMAAYCNELGLNYQMFTYRALRIKKKETASIVGISFVEIKMPRKTSTGIKYYLPNGSYFAFPAGCSKYTIDSITNWLMLK